MNDQRIIWIDIAKAFGIFLVVVGHVISSGNIISDWIYSFHMPLFFFLSGICFSKKISYPRFVVRKIKSLVLPYIYVGILISLFELYFQSFNVLSKQISHNFFNYGAMWFIPILFITEVIFYPISKIHDKYLYCFTLLIFAIIGYLLFKFSIISPMSLTSVFAATLFYGIGYVSKNTINLLFGKTYFIIIFFVTHILLLFLSDSTIGMMSNTIPQPLYNYTAAMTGLLFFCMLSHFFSTHLLKEYINVILYVGQNTLIILCFHMIFIKYSVQIIRPYINNYVLYKSLEFVFIWLLCFIIIFIIRKYFPWMINLQKKQTK
jgi:fucose 4-O-acetylase-like acetyltransferase